MYAIRSYYVRDQREQVVKLFLNFAIGMIYLIPVVMLFSSFKVSWGTGFAAVIYSGIFEVGITYRITSYNVCYTKLLRVPQLILNDENRATTGTR